MKTEAVTLTQEVRNTYARGGVIFMAQREATNENEVEAGQAEKQRQEQQRQQQAAAERARTERITERKVGEAIQKLEAKIPLKDLPTQPKDLSVVLSTHLTQDEIRAFIKDIAEAIEDPTLRATREGRILRREYKQLQERLIEAMPEVVEEALGAPTAFNEQLINQFGNFLGDSVQIVYDDSTNVVPDPPKSDGMVKVHIPKNPSVDALIDLARVINPDRFKDATQGNMLQFARDLRSAARMLEAEMVSPEAVTKLYNTGVQLERLLTKASEPKEATYGEIQKMPNVPQGVKDRIFMDMIMGRHVLTSEPQKGNLYDVQFERWQREQVMNARGYTEALSQAESSNTRMTYAQIQEFLKNTNFSVEQKKALDNELVTIRKIFLQQRLNEFKQSRSLIDRQQDYDAYLRDTDTQASLLRFLTKAKVIERSILKKGNLGQMQARAVESKLQQDVLEGMVTKWQKAVFEIEHGREMLYEVQQEIENLGANANIQQILGVVTKFFQPTSDKDANVMKYVPADIKDLFGKNNVDRNQAACAIVSGYEMRLLEELGEKYGFAVASDLSNGHATLVVVEKKENGKVFQVDPNVPYNREETNPGIVTLDANKNDAVVQELLNLARDNRLGRESMRRLIDGQWHVIGGKKSILSQLLVNINQLRHGYPEGGYLEQVLKNVPGVTQHDIDELRFAFAQKAVDADANNEYAWAAMGKTATNGRGQEYKDYAKMLNPHLPDKDEYLIGAQTIEAHEITDAHGTPLYIYGENPADPPERRISAILDDYAREYALGLDHVHDSLLNIKGLIDRNSQEHDTGRYRLIVNNIIARIEDRITADPDHADMWHKLARYTFEYSLEQIIGSADREPRSDYPNYEQDLSLLSSLNGISILAKRYDDDWGFLQDTDRRSNNAYLRRLKDYRKYAHIVFKGLPDDKQFKEGIAFLGNEGLDFIENGIAGVAPVFRQYERVYADMKATLGHAPLSTDFRNIADPEMQGHRDPVTGEFSSDGRVYRMDLHDPVTGFKLLPWQQKRAGVVGMFLSGLSQRRQIYGGGDNPTTLTDIVASKEGEGNRAGLTGGLNDVVARYFFDQNSRRLLGHIYDELHTQGGGRQYGLIMNERLIVNSADAKDLIGKNDLMGNDVTPQWKGLYGHSERSAAFEDNGSQDPRSNPWVAELIYLRQEKYRTESLAGFPWGDYFKDPADVARLQGDLQRKYPQNGGNLTGFTVGEYLDALQDIFTEAIKKDKRTSNDHTDKRALFNEYLRGTDFFQRQRLFLGSLLHYNYSGVWQSQFDEISKAIIWDKAINFLPSRVASFLPREAERIALVDHHLTQAQWSELKEKMGFAEDRRVEEDAILMRVDINDAEKRRQLQLLDSAKWAAAPLVSENNLDSYLAAQGIAPGSNEYNVVQALIHMGQEFVATDAKGNPLGRGANGLPSGEIEGGFAKMIFIFTPFLEDAPSAEWNNMAQDLIKRALVDSQSSYAESNNALVGMFAELAHKPGEFLEALKKIYTPLSSPMGKDDANEKMKCYLGGYIKLAEATFGARHFGWLYKILRIPRSEAEQGNLEIELAHGRQEIASIIDSAAQQQIINDESKYPKTFDGRWRLIRDIISGNKQRTGAQRLKKENKADIFHVMMEIFRVFAWLFGEQFALGLLKSIFPDEVARALG